MPAKKSNPNHITYQEFVSEEIHHLRQEKPNLKNTEYMKLAAKNWQKYKKEHGIVSGQNKK